MDSEHPDVSGSRTITHELTQPREVRSVDWEGPVTPQQPFDVALTQSASSLGGTSFPALSAV